MKKKEIMKYTELKFVKYYNYIFKISMKMVK